MDRKMTPQQALPKIKAVLDLGQTCQLTVTGTSMVPFLRHEKDAVILTAFSGAAVRGDILFYLRDGQTPILHRVHRVRPDGSFLICGDNQIRLETVAPAQVLATVTHVIRRGKLIPCGSFLWRFLSALWLLLYPIRTPLLKLIHRLAAWKNHTPSPH